MKIAFLGLEGLAGPMVLRLMEKGHELVVSDMDDEFAQAITQAGAQWQDHISDAVAGAQAVITYLCGSDLVEDVYMGDAGVLASAAPGTLLIDLSTCTPDLAQDIQQIAAVQGLQAVDAPVLGGYDGYDPASLTLLVGAEDAAFAKAEPILTALSDKVVRLGGPGCGQSAKIANIIALTSALAGTVEALAFSDVAEMDLMAVLSTIVAGPAGTWFSAKYGATIVNEDYDPGIRVDRFLMDVVTTLDAADRMELTLPVTETVAQLLDLLAVIGGSGKGIQALHLLYCDQDRSASQGLDWSRAEELMAHDHGHDGCGCDECGHDHGFDGHDYHTAPVVDPFAGDDWGDDDGIDAEDEDAWHSAEWDPAEWGSGEFPDEWDDDGDEG